MAKAKTNTAGRVRAGADLKEQQAALAAYRLSKGDILVEKWANTRPGTDLDRLYTENASKARLVAHSLEMQNRHLKALKEEGTLIKSMFRTTPENLLRIIRIGTANSNRSEIFNEWSLETPDDAYFFVDTIYGSTARGATAGDLIYTTTAPNYASNFNEVTIGTGNGVTLTFGPVSFSPVPLLPNTVRIFVDGKPVGNDDGAEGLTGSTINSTSSSVDYTTGAITVVFTAGNAPANGAIITAEARWDAEQSSNYDEWGSIELKLRKKRFDAQIHPLTYQYSQLLDVTLGSTGIGNVDEMLVKRVGDEHAKRKDQKAFQFAMQLARKNLIETFDADFATAGSDNDYNHAQRLIKVLAKISGKIYNQNQRGRITKIVAGSDALAEMQLLKNWKSDNAQTPGSGSYLAGYIDSVAVYGTPADTKTIQSDEALLVYRNDDEDGDVAIAFGVMTELSAVLDYPELYRKGTLATVEDAHEVNSNFLRILKFKNV